MKAAALLAASALLLGGCATYSYLLSTYNGVDKTVVSGPGGSYWVWDRPDLGKILTSPSPGTMVPSLVVQNLTLSMANADPKLAAHQQVVMDWFARDGRNCEIKTSFEIARPEYEHSYICQPAPLKAP